MISSSTLFDTATEVLAVALGNDREILARSSIDAGRSHLELLLPEIERLMGSAALAPADLEAIVAGTGPGTFSGLRVGIATARALAQTLEVPLTGFSTLEAVALEASQEVSAGSMLLPVIDARRGQVFSRLYRKEGDGRVQTESDVLCVEPERLRERIATLTGARVLAAGNGAVVYSEILSASREFDLLPGDHPGNRVNAAWHLKGADSSGAYDPAGLLTVVPEYVREPDADKTILLRKREPWLK